MPNLPAAVHNTVNRFAAAFPVPQGNPADPTWDDQLRSWTLKLCSQVCFSHGAAWGAKRADPNRPISKDSLAFVPESNALWGWDLLIGSGTGKPTLAPEPGFNDIPEQVFVSVIPHDYLGGQPEPGPDPEPGDDALALILAKLNDMDAKLDAMRDQEMAHYQSLYAQNERIFANLTAQIQSIKADKLHLQGTLRGSVLGGGPIDLKEV